MNSKTRNRNWFFATNSAKMNQVAKQKKQMRMAKAAHEKEQTLSAMEAVKNAFSKQETPGDGSASTSQIHSEEATGQDISESTT